jgi:hypothetical protein
MNRKTAIYLEGMPHFEKSMNRVAAWFENGIIDRPPVRFHRHNAQFESTAAVKDQASLWFDVEYQVESYLTSIEGKSFNGETFPVFEPNLGPNVYAAMHGGTLEFGETTSWYHPIIEGSEDLGKICFSQENFYFQKLEELTRYAIDRCKGKSLVAYTDLHPGVDCAAAWRGNDRLCMDFYDQPDLVRSLFDRAMMHFREVYDHFDAILKDAGLPSVCWMNIPDFGTLHIPSNDFSAMVGREFVKEFCLPVHHKEMEGMTRNIFHVDGPGVARHIEDLMQLPNLSAIQWVQGVGDDTPIQQWIPLLKQIRQQEIPVIVDVALDELDHFMDTMPPEGLFLWVGTHSVEEEEGVLKKLLGWRN